MNPSLSLVCKNFQELWSSVTGTPPEQDGALPLVANFKGTRLYDARAGYGKVWSWFYSFIGIFCGDRIKNERLKRAVIYTHNAFLSHLEIIHNTALEYKKNLKNMSEDRIVDEDTHRSIKNEITRWNLSTRPFVKLMKNYTNTTTQAISHVGLKNLLDTSLTHNDIKDFTSLKVNDLIICQKIIDLENNYEPTQRLPLGPLKRMADQSDIFKKNKTKDSDINNTDPKKIDDWITALNVSNPPTKLLRQGINSIVIELWSGTDKFCTAPCSENIVHSFLKDRGCLIYQKCDDIQIRLMQDFSKGSVIDFDGESFEIKAALQDPEQMSDINYYTLKDSPDTVLGVAKNKFILPLRQYEDGKTPKKSVHEERMTIISRNCLYGIVHKVVPLQEHSWKPQSDKISPEDIPRAQSIASYIKKCLSYQKHPTNLSHIPWFFNASNQFVTLDRIKKEKMDFNALEEFAIKCSGDNIGVRKFLFEKSGLSTHIIAELYRTTVLRGLYGSTMDFPEELNSRAIEDKKVLLHAEELFSMFDKPRDDLINKMMSDEPKLTHEKARIKAIKLLLNTYDETKTIGNTEFVLSSIATLV